MEQEPFKMFIKLKNSGQNALIYSVSVHIFTVSKDFYLENEEGPITHRKNQTSKEVK